MQPKRHRDYINRSPVANQLRYHRRSPDPYLKYGRNPREEGSSHLGRGLSPHNIERSRRILVDDRRSSSLERREYSWNLVAGRNEQLQSRSPHAGRLGSSRINHVRSRSPQRGHLDSNRIEHARSRSPPLGQVRVRPHLDDGLLLSKNSPTLKFRHDFQLKSIEYNDDITPNVKHNYGYGDCSSPRIRKEKDFCGSKSLYTDGQGVFVQEANLSEDDRSQVFNRMPPELGPSSNYVDRGRNKDDDYRYQNPLPSNKFSFTKPRKEIFTDNSYPGITHPKDFQSKYPYKNESSLMGLSGDDFRSSYHEKLPLFSEKYGNGSEKLRESLGFNSYSQTRLIDSSKDLDAVHKAYQRNHPRSPDQFDLNDYHYPAHPKRDSDDYGYSPGDLYGKMPGRAIDYNYRDSLRARKEEPVIDSFDDIETSTSRNLWDYPYLRNQRASNYLDVTETSKFSHRSGEYFDSKDTLADFGRRDPHLGSDSGLQRGPDFEHYKEQSRGSPSFKYREDVHGLALSQPPLRINPRESGMYGFGPSNTILNRNFEVDEESHHDLRRSMLSKWNTSGGNGDLDYDEECLDERVNVENQSERTERRLEDRLGHGGATAFHKPDRRIMKNNNKGPVLSHRLGKRVNFYHHEKVWKRSKADYYEAEHEVEADEEWVKYSRNEPPEESEEFKQLVQKAFLIFSKKLNENLSLRRKYQEQGKVGTLFCIVCGRRSGSFSDFLVFLLKVEHLFDSWIQSPRIFNAAQAAAKCYFKETYHLGFSLIII